MSLSRASEAEHDDDRELRSFGYEPQLNRSMGLFSSLSISISCMCITAGIFTVYAYSLGTVGPAFIWTWPIVALGQIIVALVLADLAGRMPLSGYAFQWTSRLVNSHYGWFTGWAGLMAFTPGFTGLNLGLSPILLNRLGIGIDATSIMVTTILLTLSQLLINLAGVRIASRINNIAAYTAELGLSVVLTVILLVVGFVTNPVQSVSFLTTSSVTDGGFLTAFLLSGLLGIWVLTGFEGAADLAEETQGARRNVPKAVVTSLILAVVIGFFMLIALTINIRNLGETTGAAVPIANVLEGALGSTGAIIFEAVAMVALYAGGLANMAASSRLIFSLSRDRMLPRSQALASVSRRTGSPSGALLLAAGLSIALVVIGSTIATQAMSLIVGMASVGYYAVYALTILGAILAARRGLLKARSSFDLGSWAVPIRWIALIWSLLVIAVLTIPTANQQTALMAGGFFVIAIVWYVAVLRGRLVRGQAGVPDAAGEMPVAAIPAESTI
ncbi:MAG TPA: amino acid permease [Candidatus Limnocylindrales bacterium]|nr:amino acid permease [Candidatus Limnocylindrales bacterium]